MLKGIFKAVSLPISVLFINFDVLYAQQEHFVLPPYRIDFTGAPAKYNLHPGVFDFETNASNGAYGSQHRSISNNLMFYVQNDVIYDQKGNYIESLKGWQDFPVTPSSCLVRPKDEIGIAPVPGSCDQFYIFYLKQEGCTWSPLIGLGLFYAVISVDTWDHPNNPVTIISNGNFLKEYHGAYDGGFAISKLTNEDTRTLYVVADDQIDRYSISSSGVTFVATDVTGIDSETMEVDLSPDGTKLAWGTLFDHKVYVSDITSIGGPPSYPNVYILPNSSLGVKGVEFNADGSQLYGSQYGLFNINFSNSNISYLNTDGEYSGTSLELAKDGKIYLAENDGDLVALDPSTNSITPFLPATKLRYSDYGHYVYTLPDQIDGEDYSYFFGSKRPVGYMTLNENYLTMATAMNIYTCEPISLVENYTNDYGYRIRVQECDASGNVISGADFYYPDMYHFVPLPTDLRTINSGYLGNSANASKYYKITVDVNNSCGYEKREQALVYLTSLTPATASFKINPGNGILAIPSSNPMSPTYTGYSPGFNGSSSLGDYDSYKVLVEKYNCATGDAYSVVCDGPFAPVSPGGFSTKSFNSYLYEACSLSGYFFNPANWNQCYKATFTVSNACGTSSSIGYFENADPNLRKGFFLSEDSEGHASGLAKVQPNPFGAEGAVITFFLEEEAKGTIKLTRIDGNETTTVVKDQLWNAGEHKVKIDGANLDKGVYIYSIVTENGLLSGKLIRN